MKRIAIKLFFVLIFSIAFSCLANAQDISVSGLIKSETIKRGSIGKGAIVLSIPKVLHINSNKPTSEFMLPTEVKLISKEVKNLKAIYPNGKDQKFDFSEQAINVYEGKTTISFVFRVPKTLRSKTIRIRAVVSYQACTNEVCYPPKKKEIVLKGTVR